VSIDRKNLGRRGEEIAAHWLTKQGYKIIEKNFSCRFGELDLVARHRAELVFVEVRCRQGEDYGWPEETVNLKKQKKLRKLAAFYLQRNKLNEHFCRFDVVAITFRESEPVRIQLIPNAF
jgi:putative endonuclease